MIFILIFSTWIQAADLKSADREAIENLARNYVAAFDQGDFSELKKCCVTEEFISSNGGDAFKKFVEERKKGESRTVKNIEVENFPFGTFLQFDIVNAAGKLEEAMGSDEWFRVEASKNAWKLQRKETDFYPGEH